MVTHDTGRVHTGSKSFQVGIYMFHGGGEKPGRVLVIVSPVI